MGKKLAIKVGYFEKYPKYILKKRCQKGFSKVILRVKPVVFFKKMSQNFQWSYFKELKRELKEGLEKAFELKIK